MEIKHSNWFAAGPEVQRALVSLSDGAFRLYFYLCLNASRGTGKISTSYSDLAHALEKSRRSISSHFDELREKRICVVAPAANQHSRTEVEICDEFWPYGKERTAIAPSEWNSFCTRIKSLLSKRACIKCEFTTVDERFAAELFARKVSLEEIEKAVALACCRKYAGLINGTDDEMIRRFGYFRDSIDEVRDPDAHPIQAQLLNQRIQTAEYYEKKWLAKLARPAGAHFASAARREKQETR